MKQYTWSFNFWLDFAAWLSLLFDVGVEFSLEEGIKLADQDAVVADNEIMKLGKTSRVATKAGRIVRILRLVRLVRLVKLFKLWIEGNAETLEDEKGKPTKIGEKYSSNVRRIVIVVVIMMIIFIPNFGMDSTPKFSIAEYGLSELHRLPQDYNATGAVSAKLFEWKVKEYIDTFADPNYYVPADGGVFSTLYPNSMDSYTSLLHIDVCTKYVPRSALSYSRTFAYLSTDLAHSPYPPQALPNHLVRERCL